MSREPVVYLWVACRSEPGHRGSQYAFTATGTPPARIGAAPHHDMRTGALTGLVRDDSRYGAWKLLGTVAGRIVMTDGGLVPMVLRPDGRVWDEMEIVAAGFYRRPRDAAA